MVQYCFFFIYFFFYKYFYFKLFFSIHFKNYQLINPYRPVWSNLAIVISKIHYRSTSNIYQHNNIFEYIKYATAFLIDDANESEIWISSVKQVCI